jgi:lipoprotein NlpI
VFRDTEQFACALAALDRRDFVGAEAAFSELLAQRAWGPKERSFLYNKRGVARIGLEQRALARADFMAALAAFDAYAPALTNLGNLLFEDGEIEAAIAQYESAIAADCDYAIAHLNLGAAYKRAGRLDQAVQALRRAQRLEQRANAARFWRPARRR